MNVYLVFDLLTKGLAEISRIGNLTSYEIFKMLLPQFLIIGQVIWKFMGDVV